MKGYSEATIRDSLVGKLDLIEVGLLFEEKEKYIPATIGTKSFIDLVARDSQNRLVLIEAKKQTLPQERRCTRF